MPQVGITPKAEAPGLSLWIASWTPEDSLADISTSIRSRPAAVSPYSSCGGYTILPCGCRFLRWRVVFVFEGNFAFRVRQCITQFLRTSLLSAISSFGAIPERFSSASPRHTLFSRNSRPRLVSDTSTRRSSPPVPHPRQERGGFKSLDERRDGAGLQR